MDTIKCPQCNQPVSPQAKFCTSCGASLSFPAGSPAPAPASSRTSRRWGIWIAAGIGFVLCCLVILAAAILLYINTDILPDIPGLSQSRSTPTPREEVVTRETETESPTTAEPEAPVVLPPEVPVSEFAGAQIQVVTEAYWAPFEFYESDGKLVGFDIDLMNAIASRVGFQVEFIDLPWDAVLSSIEDCQYDAAIAAITITPERQSRMLFSDPYISDGQVIVAQADDSSITGLDSLNGRQVAVQIGTLGEEFLSDFPEVITVPYEDINIAFDGLSGGRVDALLTYNTLALQAISNYAAELIIVGEPLTPESLGIAICPDNIALQAAINQALAELIAEGLIEQLTHTWFE
ncbi:MAG: transporter substrate-binding domain-containing protein [Anaerolineales bacterium]|jgi:ABC-type amino acid transport substrate-binding protein|nr:transporter substrate-binding domain-containing protein [Anaerolineales bacterium]